MEPFLAYEVLMKRSIPVTAIFALLTASSVALGCSGAVAPDGTGAVAPAVAANVEVTRAPLATTTHGKVKRVSDALAEVSLRSDQRVQLQALADDAEARQLAQLAARKDLTETIAVQIASGAIDRAALAPKITALASALDSSEPKDRAAFESVHAILDSAQRAEFADAMSTNARTAHLSEGWQHLKGHGPGQQWADDLNLSGDQRDAFETILHESFAGHHHDHDQANARGHDDHFGPGGWHGAGHGKAVLEAFKADTFSFDAVAPPHAMGAKVSEMSSHILDLVEKVLPLLNADQRALAAQKLREHAEHLPFGEPM